MIVGQIPLAISALNHLQVIEPELLRAAAILAAITVAGQGDDKAVIIQLLDFAGRMTKIKDSLQRLVKLANQADDAALQGIAAPVIEIELDPATLPH